MKSIWKNLPFHIFLFPTFTVLILAANNLGQIELDVILVPLLYSNAGSILFFLLGLILFKKVNRAGLFSFGLMFFLLTYGHFFDIMEGRYIGNWVIGTHFYMLILSVILFIALTVFLLWFLKNPDPLTLILNFVLVVMVILQTVRIIFYEVRSNIIERQTTQETQSTLLKPEPGQPLPDVYFIVLDKYGRSDAIQEFYNYDNSAFINELSELGFWVPSCSRSNYAFTVMSFSSQLNMSYVEDLTDDPSLKSTTALIKNNIVHQAFEDIGYTTIAFEMGFSWGNMKHFDYYFSGYPDNIDTWSIDPFELLYLRSTIGLLLFEDKVEIGEQVALSDLEQKAERTRLILEVLPEIPDLPGPKFIHAHIISPHPPYLFNPDGSINPDAEDVDPLEGYRNQLKFIEPRIIEVVSQIINNSKNPPIIIIEGDHGFGRKYVTSVLLALYLPGEGAQGLDDHTTLINVFPHIFNTYFNTNIEYLPDMSFTHTDDWYESVPIDEWNPACQSE
jgi:hypothetical protein